MLSCPLNKHRPEIEGDGTDSLIFGNAHSVKIINSFVIDNVLRFEVESTILRKQSPFPVILGTYPYQDKRFSRLKNE